MNYCTVRGNCTATREEEPACDYYKLDPREGKCDWRSWINKNMCQCEEARESQQEQHFEDARNRYE